MSVHNDPCYWGHEAGCEHMVDPKKRCKATWKRPEWDEYSRCIEEHSDGSRVNRVHRARHLTQPGVFVTFYDQVAVYPGECDVRRAWGNGKVIQCSLEWPHEGVDHDFPYPAPERVVEEEKCSACTIEGVRVARKDCPMHGSKPADARDSQVGGDHYKRFKIQPWDIWQEYGLDGFTAAIIKYLLRDKGNRLEDLRKARHTLDRLIEIEEERDGVLRKEAEEAG